jgi:hypothetical protein
VSSLPRTMPRHQSPMDIPDVGTHPECWYVHEHSGGVGCIGVGCSVISLLIGALVGSFFQTSHHAIARAMSVGAGLLLAGVSFKVAADAVRTAGPLAAALSLLVGAAMFSVSNALLARFGAAQRKRCGDCVQQPSESQQPGSGVAIALGNALDGLPEALARAFPACSPPWASDSYCS